jgi:hypothetical protein
MSTIDLGDNPVGSTPTDAQKTQLRSSIGLGSNDTVEFGALVPPAGTTAEIDAITSATVGQVMIDTERNRYVRFNSATTYDVVGLTSPNTYYVDPQNGDNTSGNVGGLPFATINGALTKAVADGAAPVTVHCMSGAYSEVDALNGISTAQNVSIEFAPNCIYSNSSMTAPVFDTTTGSVPNISYIGGGLSFSIATYGFFKGSASTSITTILEIQNSVALFSAGSFIEITGGDASVNVKGKIDFGIFKLTRELINVSGDAVVKCDGIQVNASVNVAQPAVAITKLSDTATLKLTDVSVENGGLCEIITDTACKLIIRGCVCSDGPLALPALTVKAPAGSSNPDVFAVGFNAVPAAATNITVDTTFGQFIVNASADNLL